MIDNKKDHEELLQRYIDSWLKRDKQSFLNTLANSIDIRECYGASYSTKREADIWFTEWNKLGKVLDWRIQETYYDCEKDLFFATWVFHYQYPDITEPIFDGITIMKAKDGKIVKLHEYQTKHKRFYPYK